MFDGDNVIRAYRKRYGVDFLCAIRELETLGVKLDPVYVATLKSTLEGLKQANKREKEEKQDAFLNENSDEYFSFIAGYTEGGAPFGVPW